MRVMGPGRIREPFHLNAADSQRFLGSFRIVQSNSQVPLDRLRPRVVRQDVPGERQRVRIYARLFPTELSEHCENHHEESCCTSASRSGSFPTPCAAAPTRTAITPMPAK